MSIDEKLERLIKNLSSYNDIVLAFSGGVDSTFLFFVIKKYLPEINLIPVTVVSEFTQQKNLLEAKNLLSDYSQIHEIIDINLLENKLISANSPDRCYYCKKEIFTNIKKFAGKKFITTIIEGSNLDDLADYRPGRKALRELNVISPLLDVELKKIDIRILAKRLNLSIWNKPSNSCLAARIEYGMELTEENLSRVDHLEEFLSKMGYENHRVRFHKSIARIEVKKDSMKDIINDADIILAEFKKNGIKYITLDIEGFRSGSMN